MRYLLALILLLIAPLALAGDRIATQGDDWVKLTEAPCTNEQVVARLLPGSQEDWHAANAQFQGKSYAGCWREVRNAVYLIYEDGDQGVVPASEAKSVPTA